MEASIRFFLLTCCSSVRASSEPRVTPSSINGPGPAASGHWYSIRSWIAAVACFACVLKLQVFPFGAAVVLAPAVDAALAVIIDRLYFAGRLSAWQWAGIVCAAVAIILINIGGSVCCRSNYAIQNAGYAGDDSVLPEFQTVGNHRPGRD